MNIKLYAWVSANVMEILKGFAEKFQQVGVDEANLLPVTGINIYEEATLCAIRIKDKIKRQERITRLIRVGPIS